jgi:hypothetical protein
VRGALDLLESELLAAAPDLLEAPLLAPDYFSETLWASGREVAGNPTRFGGGGSVVRIINL